MRRIPVTLRMENIEPDAWTTITFSTPNVEWSIGSGGRESLGFSCGGTDLLRVVESRFRSLEIIGPSLILRTTPDSGQTPFVFTLFVAMPDHVDMLEAHCDMKDDASISFELENFKAQIWKSGRASAMVPPIMKGIKKIDLCVNGARLGDIVQVSLESEAKDESMYWSFGPNAVSYDLSQEVRQMVQGVSIRTEDESPLPICDIRIGATVIEIELAGDINGWGGNAPDVLTIEAYVLCISQDGTGTADRPGRMLLKVDCDDDVLVTARGGYQQPQYLTSVYQPFEF